MPVQGVAGILLAGKHTCAKAAEINGSENTASQASCCNDTEKLLKTGKLCKAEQSCQTADLSMTAQTNHQFLSGAGSKIRQFVQLLTLNAIPSNTWRPPNPL
jgi:hypothetical protein